MAELVTIPISFFEVTTDYEQPDVRLLGDRTLLVHGILEAWHAYKPTVDDIDVLSTGKNSEQGVMFKLPEKQISFFVGATFCRFSRGAVSWEMANETIEIMDLSLATLQSVAGVALGKKRTALGMHIQPRIRSYKDLLLAFMPSQLVKIDPAPFRTGATIIRWDNNRAITLDGSGTLANAIFLKLERTFIGTTPHEEIAKQLWNDEMEIFGIMDIEEER